MVPISPLQDVLKVQFKMNKKVGFSPTSEGSQLMQKEKQRKENPVATKLFPEGISQK